MNKPPRQYKKDQDPAHGIESQHRGAAKDKTVSAVFLAKMFGLRAPLFLGPLVAVRVEETSLEDLDANGDILPTFFLLR